MSTVKELRDKLVKELNEEGWLPHHQADAEKQVDELILAVREEKLPGDFYRWAAMEAFNRQNEILALVKAYLSQVSDHQYQRMDLDKRKVLDDLAEYAGMTWREVE